MDIDYCRVSKPVLRSKVASAALPENIITKPFCILLADLICQLLLNNLPNIFSQLEYLDAIKPIFISHICE